MTTDRSTEYLTGLMRELCKLPRETEWVEFKDSNDDPEEIENFRDIRSQSALLRDGAKSSFFACGIELIL